ncbi:ABC transporter permease [bacterium]|nr:ABC transporter permease [bacterium]
MNKTVLIIQREYLTRVQKKSFIIMSILGPLLIAALMIVPVWLATQDEDKQIIEVVDETSLFINKLEDTENLSFYYKFRSLSEAKKDLYSANTTAILFIPDVAITSPNTIQIFYKKKPSTSSMGYIKSALSNTIEDKKLQDFYKVSKDEINAIKTPVRIVSSKLKESGEEQQSGGGVAMVVAFASAIFIYFFIFLFGVQVMRGVIEEKTSRIVEVIISSVKPFQLMMGKIIGIALVALTQFLLWVVLSTALITGVSSIFADEFAAAERNKATIEQMNPDAAQLSLDKKENFIAEVKNNIEMINFPLILGCFLFYFLVGYLLYSALFAAIGSVVDQEADSQQFMMPVTIPLIFSFVIAQNVMDNPDGPLAFWTSIIPFTSPIIMMVRIPFGVQWWELALSMGLLILTFIGAVWFAAKIYRVGILMYGKKVSYKEIGKWLFYKN